MKRLLYSTILCLALAIPSMSQIVKTTVEQGEIEGVLQDGYALYKRIPYAEAPIGNLRWKMPVAKKPWKGIYKSNEWGNRPYQVDDPNQGISHIPMSEDCLYLSVGTPAKSKDEKLPVFVMIHGGGFSTGSYIGTQESFVHEGIVYVSIEYRLGALGFMAHPELSKESSKKISGNYGIYDQIMALQWIHNNIAAFGGDPNKVTICGESAGGYSVGILCASPLCKGLFRAAISESGGFFGPVSKQPYGGPSKVCYEKTAETIGTDFQKKLNAKNIKELRSLSAQTILDSTGYTTFWPVVDGYAIVDDQYTLYEQGKYNDVDILIGFNDDEGSLFIYNATIEQYKQTAQDRFGSYADKFIKAYPAHTNQEALYALQDMFRDCSFGWNTYAWANLQSKTGKGNVYVYYFAQKSQNSILKDTRGATHVAEMPFIYGYNFGGTMTETDTHMYQVMSKYWINFIKKGNPNAEGLPFWSTYKQGEETIMTMKKGFYLSSMPNQEKMNFFEEFYKSVRDK